MNGLSVLGYALSLYLAGNVVTTAANGLPNSIGSNNHPDTLHDLYVRVRLPVLRGDSASVRSSLEFPKETDARDYDVRDVDTISSKSSLETHDTSSATDSDRVLIDCPRKCKREFIKAPKKTCRKHHCKRCSMCDSVSYCPEKCEGVHVTWATKCSSACNQCKFPPCRKCRKNEDACALQKLYHATDGGSWISDPFLDRWYHNKKHCTWYGVECVKGTVSNITLDKNNLVGEIPSEIFLLPGLRFLQLEHNHINGSFPDIEPNLKESKLERINLNGNHLTGIIPSLTFFTELQVLFLSKNSLDGPIPEFPANISRVDLSQNSITGTLEDAGFDSDTSMLELNLRDNRMHGTIPDNLGQLEDLDLSRNYFNGSVPFFFSEMKSLNISHNKLSGIINPNVTFGTLSVEDDDDDDYDYDDGDDYYNLDTYIPFELQQDHDDSSGNKSVLEVLDLSSNRIMGQLPRVCCVVKTVILSDNRFTGTVPDSLWDATHLSLSNNLIDGHLPPNITGTMLKLHVQGNKMYGPVPYDLGHLEDLDLSDNEFTGSIPSVFPSLKYLRMSNNKLNGSFPFATNHEFDIDDDYFYDGHDDYDYSRDGDDDGHDHNDHEHPHFEDADTINGQISEDNNFGGSSADQPSNVHNDTNHTHFMGGFNTSLIVLDLSSNSITGLLPVLCCDIEEVNLSNNEFRGTIPNYLWFSTVLRLNNNYIRDKLPTFILRNTDPHKVIDLSDNLIFGTIPMNFLANSNWVNLGHNQLTGNLRHFNHHYPPRNGSEYFLNDNMITGTIPDCLWFHHDLESVTLENNLIEGRISQNSTTLHAVSLGSNLITGTIPSRIGDSPLLTKFNLEDNCITGTVPDQLGLLTGGSKYDMITVDLMQTGVTGSILNRSDICENEYLTVIVDLEYVHCECCPHSTDDGHHD